MEITVTFNIKGTDNRDEALANVVNVLEVGFDAACDAADDKGILINYWMPDVETI